MISSCSKHLVLVFMCFLSGVAHAAQSLDTIIIDTGYDKQTKIAVVPFRQGPEFSKEQPMADIVAFDLARSGQFAPIEADNMLSRPTSATEVFFRDWRVLGVEYLLIGRTGVDSLGNLTVEYNLYDVFNEREMKSDKITTTRTRWRDAAHRVSDEVFQAVTGIRGAFSTRILYVLATGAGSPDATYRLEMADADGERAKTLFSSKQPIMAASWSPDGKQVAYSSFETGRPAIVLQNVETGARELVTQFSGINSSPVFSPDGTRLAMVLSRDGNPEIYVMNLADRSLRRVTRNQVIDTEPSWSEDGKSVIYTSDRGGRPQIYRQDLTNNFVERLTFQGDYNARARLLPGGKQLIYVHRNNGIFHIAWQDLERDDVRVLTRTAMDESPSLAPNGTMLIYATQDQGKGILAVVSIDGRVKYRLPSSAGDVREPAWSPYLDTL